MPTIEGIEVESELPAATPQSPLQGIKGWGASRLVPVDGSAVGAQNRIFLLQANFKEPGEYTVQFSISNAQPFASSGGCRAKATLIWSVAGFSMTRQVSITNGTSISGVGEGVAVYVEDDTPWGTVVPAGFQGPTVTATVSKGGRGSDTNPPVLVPSQLDPGAPGFNFGRAYVIANGAFLDIPVPQGVGVKSVLTQISPTMTGGPPPTTAGAPILEGQVVVQQLSTSGATIVADSLAQYDPRTFQWVPMNPSCQFIRVTNLSGQSIRVDHIFGIDG